MRCIEDTSAFGLPIPERLLDPDAVLDRLRSGPLLEGYELRAVRPRYLRLKAATSLLVLYDADVLSPEGEEQVVPVHGIQGDGSLARREQAKWRMLHPGLGDPGRSVQIDAEHDVVMARFPYDIGLRELPWATEPQRIKRLHEELGYVLTGGEEIPARARGTEATVLSYRPRRRCVLRWRVRTRPGDTTVYRRAVVRVLSAAPRASVEWRREDSPSFVPRLLGTSSDHRILVEEDLESEAITERMRLAPTRELGRLVGRLHEWAGRHVGAGRPGDPERFVARWVREAMASLEHLAVLQTSLTTVAAELRQRLGNWRWQASPSLRWTGIHGDLHPGQIVHDEGAWKVVDLDRAGAGPAEADLGTLLSHLQLEGREEASAFAELCAGYAEVARVEVDATALTAFAALALLRSSVDLTRRFEVQALARTRRRLFLAADLLERAAAPS